MFEGVIFDMDGLMFDTEPVWVDAWVPTLASVGIDFPPALPDATRGTSGKRLEAIIHQFFPEVDATYVRETLAVTAQQMMLEGVPKKPGLNELLAFLAECGIPLAVASSSPLQMIELHLENAGIRSYFSELVSGVQLSHSKPEPDIFLLAADLLGVPPAHTLVLEDSLAGVRAGVAGGFVTVMVPDLDVPDDFAQKNAARICKDLLEVRDLLAAGELG